jgi:LysR family hydrogen peroxide-inducible transcriptional activator
MELHQLRYFLAVARFRSFTRAAEHAHVAQPSLSQQIRKLEHELGSPLFDRLGKTIRLTSLGERFQNHARRILADLEGARREVDEMLGAGHGEVSAGIIPTLAPFVLPRALSLCANSFPQIAVSIREELTDSLLHYLSEGELDLALMGRPGKRKELIAEPLFEDRMLLAVPLRHRLWRRRRSYVAFHEVAKEPFLLLKDGHCFREDVLRVCQRSRLNPNVVFEGGQLDTLVAMVAAGAGVTLLPEIARDHYRNAGVGLLEFQPPSPTRVIAVVRPRHKFLTSSAQAFIEVIKKITRPPSQIGV